MEHLAGELAAAVAAWDGRGWPRPGALLISGSGLAADLDLPSRGRRPLQELIPWPIHAVAGHPLEVEVLAPPGLPPVLYSHGRLHAYQGYTAQQTVFLVRLGRLLGARTLLLTNASGAVQPTLVAGSLVLVTDHLNLTGLNPLYGAPPADWGPRFPDMARAYDPGLRALLRRHAESLGLQLAEGVYAGLAGPSYETPAEVRMLRTLGADLVGMSTVLEVIAGRHMGMRCACLSLASNPAAGIVDTPLDHEEVLAAGRQAASRLRELFGRALRDPELYEPAAAGRG
ncbi:MAG TPA: purine-nucleoside phosphorylase [Thermoanaerobaculia bacterium]|nr:purine-nucleoside phosphorylase [Thermoanaerobaculia bacterium]